MSKHDCETTIAYVEYDYTSLFRYDGVSEVHCRHGRFGRWCGLELFGNEVEPPFCKGQLHPQQTMEVPDE